MPKTQYALPEGFQWLTPEQEAEQKKLALEAKKAFYEHLQGLANTLYPEAEAAALPAGQRPTLYNPLTRQFEEVPPALAAQAAIPLGPPRATGEHAPEGGVIFSHEPWVDLGAQNTPSAAARKRMLAQADTSNPDEMSTDTPTGGTRGLPEGFQWMGADAPEAQADAGESGYEQGLASTFGYNDPEDSGVGAWGDNTNDPNAFGVSLPIATLEALFGNADKAYGATVEVQNPSTGQTIRAPILDKGPANWVIARQGPTIDVTEGARRALGMQGGKEPMNWKVLGHGVPADGPGSGTQGLPEGFQWVTNTNIANQPGSDTTGLPEGFRWVSNQQTQKQTTPTGEDYIEVPGMPGKAKADASAIVPGGKGTPIAPPSEEESNRLIEAEQAKPTAQPPPPQNVAIDNRPPAYVEGKKPGGMVEQGTLNIRNRPIVDNGDGSISTDRTISINENGKEVLIPTVVNGKVVPKDEAISHYHQTNEHFGKFDSVQAADKYAKTLHERPDPRYTVIPAEKVGLPEGITWVTEKDQAGVPHYSLGQAFEARREGRLHGLNLGPEQPERPGAPPLSQPPEPGAETELPMLTPQEADKLGLKSWIDPSGTEVRRATYPDVKVAKRAHEIGDTSYEMGFNPYAGRLKGMSSDELKVLGQIRNSVWFKDRVEKGEKEEDILKAIRNDPGMQIILQLKNGIDQAIPSAAAGTLEALGAIPQHYQNAYLNKTPQEAAASIPLLQKAIEMEEKRLHGWVASQTGEAPGAVDTGEVGAYPRPPQLPGKVTEKQTIGSGYAKPTELAGNIRSSLVELANLNRQLAFARDRATNTAYMIGTTPTEGMAGKVSRYLTGEAKVGRQEQAAIQEKAKGFLDEDLKSKGPIARFLIENAGSFGSNFPTFAMMYANPVIGGLAMSAQQYDQSFQEAKKGGKSDEQARVYAFRQQEQMPWELVGDFGAAMVIKQAWKEIALKNVKTGKDALKLIFQSGSEAALSEAITQPPQTFIQETGAEQAGLQPPTTTAQKWQKAGYETLGAAMQGFMLGGGGATVAAHQVTSAHAANVARVKSFIAAFKAQQGQPYAQGGAVPPVTGPTVKSTGLFPGGTTATPAPGTPAAQAPKPATITERFNALDKDARARVSQLPVMKWEAAITQEEQKAQEGKVTPTTPVEEVSAEGPNTDAELEKMKADYLGGPEQASAFAQALGARTPEEERRVLSEALPHFAKLHIALGNLGIRMTTADTGDTMVANVDDKGEVTVSVNRAQLMDRIRQSSPSPGSEVNLVGGEEFTHVADFASLSKVWQKENPGATSGFKNWMIDRVGSELGDIRSTIASAPIADQQALYQGIADIYHTYFAAPGTEEAQAAKADDSIFDTIINNPKAGGYKFAMEMARMVVQQRNQGAISEHTYRNTVQKLSDYFNKVLQRLGLAFPKAEQGDYGPMMQAHIERVQQQISDWKAEAKLQGKAEPFPRLSPEDIARATGEKPGPTYQPRPPPKKSFAQGMQEFFGFAKQPSPGGKLTPEEKRARMKAQGLGARMAGLGLREGPATYEQYLKEYQDELNSILDKDRQGTARGLQAARLIRERAGARAGATGGGRGVALGTRAGPEDLDKEQAKHTYQPRTPEERNLPNETGLDKLNKPEGGYWLSPSGRLYNVRISGPTHYEYAHYTMGLSMDEAFKKGWVRVLTFRHEKAIYWDASRLNSTQKETLKDMGTVLGYNVIQDQDYTKRAALGLGTRGVAKEGELGYISSGDEGKTTRPQRGPEELQIHAATPESATRALVQEEKGSARDRSLLRIPGRAGEERPGLGSRVDALEQSQREQLDSQGRHPRMLRINRDEQGKYDNLGLPDWPEVFSETDKLPDGTRVLQKTSEKDTMWVMPGSKAHKELGFKPGTSVSREAFHEALFKYKLNSAPQGLEHPEVLFMGGGPAAGKSKILENEAKKKGHVPKDALTIAADDLRDYITEFEMMRSNGDYRGASVTDQEAGDMTKALIQRAMDARMNIILDGLMRVPATVEKSVNLFRERGYKARALMLTVDPYEALMRIQERFARDGRYTPTDFAAPAHASVNAGMAAEGFVNIFGPEFITTYENTDFQNPPQQISGQELVDLAGRRQNANHKVASTQAFLDSYSPVETGLGTREAEKPVIHPLIGSPLKLYKTTLGGQKFAPHLVRPVWDIVGMHRFYSSTARVFDRLKGVEYMGPAIRKNDDLLSKYRGEFRNRAADAFKGAPRHVMEEYKQYWINNQFRGRNFADNQPISPQALKLVNLSKDIFREMGDRARGKIKIYNPETKIWRPFQPRVDAFRDYHPHILRDDIRDVIHNAASDPAVWNELQADMIREGIIPGIDPDAEMTKHLSNQLQKFTVNGFFGSLERSRTADYPTRAYDFSAKALFNYIDGWAERMAQTEAFGQGVGEQKTLWDLAIQDAGNQATRDFVKHVRNRIYGLDTHSLMGRAVNSLTRFAVGEQLGSFFYTGRNLVFGTGFNWQHYGTIPFARSVLNLAATFRNIREGKAKGIVLEDIMNVTRDGGRAGWTGRWASTLLKIHGNNQVEAWLRGTAMGMAKIVLRTAIKRYGTNPRGMRVRQFIGYLDNLGFKGLEPHNLLIENGNGPLTDRYLRASVKAAQGGYTIAQTTLFADSPEGRFWLMYSKFGLERIQDFALNVSKPFLRQIRLPGTKQTVKIVEKNGQPVDVRVPAGFVPMLRYLVVLGGAGAGWEWIAENIFGIHARTASWAEIFNTMDENQGAAFADVAEKLFSYLIQAGAFGLAGNYAQMGMDITQRVNFKSPLDPAALQPLKDLGQEFLNFLDQGPPTSVEDAQARVDKFLEKSLSGYKRGKQMLVHALTAYEKGSQGGPLPDDVFGIHRSLELGARRADYNFVRAATHRYDREIGVRANVRSPGTYGKNMESDFRDRVNEDLILGDTKTAEKRIKEHFKDWDPERQKIEWKNLKQSVAARQPVKAGAGGGDREAGREEFKRWADRRLPKDQAAIVDRVDKTYRETAQAINPLGMGYLMKADQIVPEMRLDKAMQRIKALQNP